MGHSNGGGGLFYVQSLTRFGNDALLIDFLSLVFEHT